MLGLQRQGSDAALGQALSSFPPIALQLSLLPSLAMTSAGQAEFANPELAVAAPFHCPGALARA